MNWLIKNVFDDIFPYNSVHLMNTPSSQFVSFLADSKRYDANNPSQTFFIFNQVLLISQLVFLHYCITLFNVLCLLSSFLSRIQRTNQYQILQFRPIHNIHKLIILRGICLRRASSSGLADQTNQEGEVSGSLICAGSGKVNWEW